MKVCKVCNKKIWFFQFPINGFDDEPVHVDCLRSDIIRRIIKGEIVVIPDDEIEDIRKRK